MAHEAQREFVEKVRNRFPDFFNNKKVLEIGSLNINGTLRDFFSECDYIGIDVGEGRGVDLVCGGQEYDAPDSSYDVTCSAECFEHNPYWVDTTKNMIRLTKPNGLVLITCATDGRPEHGTTRTDIESSPLTVNWDYYRNLNENDFASAIDFDKYFSSYQFLTNKHSHDIYFLGIRNDTPSEFGDFYKNKPIPVMGTAIVNGVHWLERLLNSIDYPIDEFVIFNNNGRGQITKELDELVNRQHNYIKKISLCHMPSNIGCPAAWNLIIKSFLTAPYWIITNHDIAFTPGFLKEMVDRSKPMNVGMVHCFEGYDKLGSFECFLIKDWVVQEYGLFDENLYPAYTEDLEYLLRTVNKPFDRVHSVSIPFYHGETEYKNSGSQTWRTEPELKEKIDNARIMNEEYIAKKWGPEWNNILPYKTPFDKDIPITYTQYDLNFCRKKYMGF